MVGALISHYASKARGTEEHARTLELLAYQDEREIARRILTAAREFRVSLNAADSDFSYGQLHNDWQDRILFPAREIRSNDLKSRAGAGLYVIGMAAFIAPKDYATYAVLTGCEDIESWAEAWLRRDDTIPEPRLPTQEEIATLVNVGGNRVSLEPLNERLQRSS